MGKRTMTVNKFAGEGGEEYALRRPWPKDCFVQGGHNGVVLVRKGVNYETAYFEAFPDTFIRGEGKTLEEAEDDCWEKFTNYTRCPEHEYETRGYTNGAGFCKHCGQFKSHAFTPEDLGFKCEDCGAFTNWCQVDDEWYCPIHEPVHEKGDSVDYRYERDHDPAQRSRWQQVLRQAEERAARAKGR